MSDPIIIAAEGKVILRVGHLDLQVDDAVLRSQSPKFAEVNPLGARSWPEQMPGTR